MMVAYPLRWLTPAALCAAAFATAAQTPPSSAPRADPLDARASVPGVAYESAFSRYRRTTADKAIPWREANDTTARIGGWRAYASEAQQPEPSPSASVMAPVAPTVAPTAAPTATPPAKPDPKAMRMPSGHGGHVMP